MTDWQQFAAAAPDLAAFGESRFQSRIGYLATIRDDGSPRVHPVSPFIANGRLFVYMEPASPKAQDLRRRKTYALHCAVEDNAGGGGEFAVRGDAQEVIDHETRRLAFKGAAALGYSPQDRYILFELRIVAAMSTVYKGEKPERVRWKAA